MMIRSLIAHALVLAASVALVGCGDSAAPGPGARCATEESSECATGTSCLDMHDTFLASNDAGCSAGIAAEPLRVCTRVCQATTDCADLGADVVCSPNGCAASGLCWKQGTAGPGSP